MKLFSVSDVHVDQAENMRWIEALDERPEDALILAGDVSDKPGRRDDPSL